MSIIQEYIAANSKWLDARVSANLCQIPDAAWPSVLAALEELYTGANEPGIDCDVAITHETIADFDDTRLHHWRERGARNEIDCSGRPAVFYAGFQRFKGSPRERCIVLDVGDRRVVLL